MLKIYKHIFTIFKLLKFHLLKHLKIWKNTVLFHPKSHWSGSVSQRYWSEDPDPHENVTDPGTLEISYLQAELELVVLRGLGLLPRLQLQGGQEHVLKPEPTFSELGPCIPSVFVAHLLRDIVTPYSEVPEVRVHEYRRHFSASECGMSGIHSLTTWKRHVM